MRGRPLNWDLALVGKGDEPAVRVGGANSGTGSTAALDRIEPRPRAEPRPAGLNRPRRTRPVRAGLCP
ncbi:hypothetical protein E9232_000519 [Inquilinus ginsengisoli]|uniref:Uncharacterized protein n=1 Tax=Inquilinus ginsengisoli TaxID=363840 RepID=A0ABU1JHE1_9PROT|nr:hypothetical protein [Inquilinus ginsengisoli]